MLSGKGCGVAEPNQEVGLEAAILERVVYFTGQVIRADNVAGLKHTAEAVAFMQCSSEHGPVAGPRVGGQVCGWVGERRVAVEAAE